MSVSRDEEIWEMLKRLLHQLEIVEKRVNVRSTTYPGLYFEDNSRRIDYIMVYDLRTIERTKNVVNFFIESLQNVGIQFEAARGLVHRDFLFIKVHCPDDILTQVSEAYKYDLLMNSPFYPTEKRIRFNCFYTPLTGLESDLLYRAPDSLMVRTPNRITAAERIRLLRYLLDTAQYGEDFRESGIQTLEEKKYILTSYPLHDGPAEWTETGPLSHRQLLLKYWASGSMWYKTQPLDLINRYFGPEMAFYYSLYGFYNKMLVPAAIMGVISVLYGKSICRSDKVLCPRCNYAKMCNYVNVSSACFSSKISYSFNNVATFTYALSMCLWAALFLEFWKRRQTMLMYRWNLYKIEKDVMARPQFAKNTKYRYFSERFNMIVPYVPMKIFLLKKAVTYFIVGFTIVVLIWAVIIALYLKIYMMYILVKTEHRSFLTTKIQLFSTFVSTLFIVIFMITFEKLYEIMARLMTRFENPRTQQEYDSSYIYKMFVLCFVNAYAFLFYNAHLKGTFFTHPGDLQTSGGWAIVNADFCPIYGCGLDVSYQMFITLSGKAIFRSALSYFKPCFVRYWHQRKTKHSGFLPFWERAYADYVVDRYFLFQDYKDMILQYGYIVLFTTSFPLAPLTALIFNVLDLRYDAKKMTHFYRRPIAYRPNDLGAWTTILKYLTIIGIAANAAIISFNTNFVPFIFRLYNFSYRKIVDLPLSEFAVDDFGKSMSQELKTNMSGKVCYYPGHRYPPKHEKKYKTTPFVAQKRAISIMCFLVIEIITLLLTRVVTFCVPDISRAIKERLMYAERLKDERREYATNRIM